MSAAAGAWSPEPSSLEYQWQRCNAAGEECVNVSEATSSTYQLAESDVGATVRVAVTADDRGGSGRAWSPPSRTVVPPAPINAVSPTIAGRAMEGETLQASPGMWWHEPTAYAYQWESCNSRGESCASIAGATSSEYRIGTGEANHRLRVAVTATNAGGSTQASSPATSMVESAEPTTQPPANTALPSVSGTVEEGQTLTASPGTWTGSPTYAYQWQDCNALGEGCLSVSGATSSSYALAASDVGHTVRVVVTATNAGGSAQASSAATASVVAAPPAAPTNTVLPAVSGTAEEGKTLSASTGTWTGSPTSYAYQWEDCNSSGASCSAIGGATGATRVLASSDVGHTLRVVVKATNAGGSGEAASAASGTVVAEPPAAPTNSVLPAVSGTAEEGKTLSASTGTWTGSPTSYAYQWEDCNSSGASCSAIGGATASTRVLASSDVGHTLKVVVKATNAGGSGEAASAASGTVVAEPPAAPTNSVLPSVSGTAEEGKTLSASTGTWTGSPTSYAYQWEDCNSSGASCSAISGATASTRVLASSDVGHTLRVVVKATNAGGSGEAASAASGTVVAEPPAAPTNSVLPSVSGTAEEGKTLSASTGTWTGSPTSYAYQWEDCNSSGASCSAISGATASTRVLASSDVGHTLKVVVRATNTGGSGEATSAATAVVVSASGSGGGTELHPNLTATDCFEYPKIEIEGKIVGEGTERITRCGYATPEDVGAEAPVADGGTGKKCSELPVWNKATEPMNSNATITGKLITEGQSISASHLTLKDDCIVVDGHGGCGPSNESGCPSTILYTSAANYLTMENTTIRATNNSTEAAEVDIYNEGDGNTGVLLKKDVIEGCGGGGGCIKGGAANGKTFELLETYMITNANVGKIEGSLDVHREDVDLDEGNITFRKSTVFNPTNEVAIVFGETNEGEPNVDEFVGEENFISGAGQEFGAGKNANAPLDPKNDIFRNNRFARCLTTPMIGGSGWGEPQECSGPYYEGGDSHGFMPKSGQERIFSPPLGAPETFKVGVWEGNFWDDNRHEVKEHNEEGAEL